MLYKKVHRQYLREWRIGRKFKYLGEVYEITKEKPFIDIECGNIRIDHWFLILILIDGEKSGQLWCKDNIEWLD